MTGRLVRCTFPALSLMYLCSASSAGPVSASFAVAADGRTQAAIVVPARAGPGVRDAAELFADLVLRIAGVRLPIVAEAPGPVSERPVVAIGLGATARQLGVTLDGKGRELKYAERIDALQQDLGSTFPRLERAVRTSATEEVDEIFKVYSSVKSQCRALRDEVLADELPTREAAVTVLLLHVFSRINAHIGNAATGIVFPIEDIDFVSRGLRRAGKADQGTGTP